MRITYCVLALCATVTLACGQKKPGELLADRLAQRLATKMVLERVLEEAKYDTIFVTSILEPADEPLNIKLARYVIGPRESVSEDTLVSLLNACITAGAGIAEAMATGFTDEYGTTLIKSASSGSNVEIEEEIEIRRNGMVTPELANKIARFAARLDSERTKKLVEARAKLMGHFRLAIGGHPELLKPLAQRKGPSDELQKSRAHVQTLLKQARVGK